MRTATSSPEQPISLDFQPSPTRAGRLRRMARGWWRSYWDWRARQATILILRSLDERTLHDIGITPSEIESCVYSKVCDRRRNYDSRW